jgi:hypothetical protein
MTQVVESIGWFSLAHTPRRLLALWRANHRRGPSEPPRTAAGFRVAADRARLDASRSVGTLGSAVGLRSVGVQRPSRAVVCNSPVHSKRRCYLRGLRADFFAPCSLGAPSHNRSVNGTPNCCAQFGSLRCAPAPVTSNVSRPMKLLMRFTLVQLATPERKWLAVAVVLAAVFGLHRFLRIPPAFWLLVLVVDLCCCAILKNMQTQQQYHGLPKDRTVSENEVAEHAQYVKFLGDLIQVLVGIAFTVVLSFNLSRIGL